MIRSLNINAVWIIESVADGEAHTGIKLFEDVFPAIKKEYTSLVCNYVEVPDRESFFEVFDIIKCHILAEKQKPIIHMEMHANTVELGLKSGERVLYDELLPIFQEINILTENNLFITLSACFGAHISSILTPIGPSPFWANCGPTNSILDIYLLIGYKAFYRALFASHNINNALEKMKAASPACSCMNFFSSELMFLRSFQIYLNNHCTERAIDERVKRIIKKVPKTLDRDKIVSRVIERLGTENGQRNEFERFKKRFFFYDKVSDPNTLPNPTFEDAMKLEL